MIDMIVQTAFPFRVKWREIGVSIQTASYDEARSLSLAGLAEYADPPSAELINQFSDDETTTLMARALSELAYWQLTYTRLTDLARARGIHA